MSVKVAVRVRPFNTRENDMGCKLCVDMNGPTTTLINPEDEKTRDFHFDYSFWSHDGFTEEENGYLTATSDRYADQQKVFDLVGKEVLDNAWEGYHCCLFAYGQTGSGKSYSMVGYGANKGIVPIAMQDIFTRIEKNTNPDLSFQVSFSMLEIYNEKIQDLLVSVKERPAEGLKIREHQKFGVYVEGQSKHPVDSYKAIEAKVEEGGKNRTIGATLMNASSSRAHTIMTIEFKRIEIIDKKKTERFSIINLVDLAGSEKIAKTGATGDRLKEGCAINKSLSMLGLVISRLADKSMGKKNIIVPYRDSALTRILQNALGGNSKTLMICAISPATDNYEETLSTLRYADQAKKIKNNATINESEQDKMIRELKEENDKLKELLKNFKLSDNRENFKLIDDETLRKYLEMEEQLKSNALLMANYEKTFEERLAEAKAKAQEKKTEEVEEQIDKTKPYLMNLNEDPLLSGKVLHSLDRELVRIGKKNGSPLPDVILGGISIKPNHAEIWNKEGKITLFPCDEEAGDQLYINGQKVHHATELFHNDRIIIGTNAIFLMKYPGKEEISPNLQKVKENDLDWEFAQAELIDTMDREKKIRLEELEKSRKREAELKIQSIEDKFQKEKKENELNIQKQKEEYERKLRELTEKMKKETEQQMLEMERREAEKEWKEQFARYEAECLLKDKERERMQREVQEEAARKRFKEQEKIRLEQKLAKHLSQITEVNLIAKELHRAITFSVKLIYNYISGAELQLLSQEKTVKTKILVLVNNRETTTQYLWSLTKFTNRFFMIKDLLEQHYEGIKLPLKNTPEDPFWDPPEPHLVGQAFLSLESLGYLLDNPTVLTLVGDNGPIGKLQVNIVPTNQHGEEIIENSEMIDNPIELLSRRLDFNIEIYSAELPGNFCQDTFCTYALMNEHNEWQTFKTSVVNGVVQNPGFNYKGHHTYYSVDEKILNYVLNHNLKIQLYGHDIPEERVLPRGIESSGTWIKSRRPQQESFENNSETTEASMAEAFNNESPENRYRKTIFAPGAAVNVKKHANMAEVAKNYARNPKLDFPTIDDNKSPKKKSDKEKKSSRKEGGKTPKKEECNIF